MRAISLFSGVGGIDLGFERAGIHTVLQAEQDPACLQVLAKHWPDTMRVTDVSHVTFELAQQLQSDHGGRDADLRRGTDHVSGEQIEPGTGHRAYSRGGKQDDGGRDGESEPQPGERAGGTVLRDTGSEEWSRGTERDSLSAQERGGADREGRWSPYGVDLIYGGFPCQDLSVAGKRAGLGGERSGLWFEFWRVLSELRPRWAVIENVPGLLSSNGGRDFAVILDGLGELGFDVGWAILDAQHFGVPQRRRRVFIVAGTGRRAVEQVLSICESCGGNPEASRAPRQGATSHPQGRPGSAGQQRPLAIEDPTGKMSGGPEVGLGISDGPMYTLGADPSHVHGILAPTVTGEWGEQAFRGDGSEGIIAAPLGANEGGGPRLDLDHDTYIVGTLDSEVGGGKLTTQSAASGHHEVTAPEYWNGDDLADTLNVSALVKRQTMPDKGRFSAVNSPAGVRRLTPLECERLQGFPDGWTEYGATYDDPVRMRGPREVWRLTRMKDSYRYRMMGNAVCVPVAEWLGHRIVAVDRTL